jgi:DNA-binding NtrC family response regulator
MNENNPPVCVIDDDSSVRESLSDLLKSVGLKAQTFASAQEFLSSWPQETRSCLVLDVRLPGMSGLDLQHQLGSADTQIPIVFMTGYGDIPMSVRAMKAGAVEFLTKPFRDEDLLNAVDQAVKRAHQFEQSKNTPTPKQLYPEDERLREFSFSETVGKSAVLRRVLQQVETVAPTDSTVLILGETGTGKELIARALHLRSRRKQKPLVRVNCTSIPKDCLRANFLATPRAPLRAPSEIGPAASRPPRVEPCFWMRSVKSLWSCRANCCAFYRRNLTSVSERRKPGAPMCASLPPLIET